MSTLPSLGRIAGMDHAALSDAYSRVFDVPVPRRMSRVLLARILAYEVQVKAKGGIPAALRRRLTNIANETARKKTTGLKPGARLVREWNGISHVVDVVETGFIWKGETYRSLTAIATAITGTRWSGPRFFNLTGTRR